MINAQEILFKSVQKALKELYSIDSTNIVFQKTRKEFEGDFTLVTFPFIKEAKKSPEQVGQELGDYLVKNEKTVIAFNVVKGFLNIVLSDAFWLSYFNSVKDSSFIGFKKPESSGRTVMLEYASPNTNKPLHLGHVRNLLVGFSVAEILKANGHKVIKASIVNDRGIHICKSMLAWKKWGNNETPVSTGMKGDHLVGKYYVKYDQEYKKEIDYAQKTALQAWIKIWAKKPAKEGEISNQMIMLFAVMIFKLIQSFDQGKPKQLTEVEIDKLASGNVQDLEEEREEEFMDDAAHMFYNGLKKELEGKKLFYKIGTDGKKEFDEIFEFIKAKLPLVMEVQDMLRKWEAGDKETVNLWKMMNGWVYEGFDVTYKTVGVDFDQTYYESNTYILGKEIVQDGLAKGIFYKKENGSVAIDLRPEGLDEKVVLRSDGTSVYITQDIGTAIERFKQFPDLKQLIYTVGNEQDFHFKVLFKILEKLGYDWAKECYHLSYGMVELPEGKMKSREGTVVDADDLLGEMFTTAEETTKELGKVEGFNEDELKDLYHTIGSGALKYFILKVDPKKKMLFDPKESIDFNGNTGPFIQYTHARIKSVLRKSESSFEASLNSISFNALEREIIKHIYDFESVVEESGNTYSPALIANYVYELTKTFNKFYHDHSILKEENEDVKVFRLQMAKACSQTIANAMGLLGIKVPEKM
ncbi:MAG: argS [Bacteroidetes bacterium]|jgi:arginyl-tRNA synthetase|nr:argS [Bacteroidota bacterium]